MNTRKVTIYRIVPKYTYGDNDTIKKEIITLSKEDSVKNTDGYIAITLKDACQSGHNGDWYDDHINGFETFKLAKNEMINRVKVQIQKLKDKIKQIKSTKESLDG